MLHITPHELMIIIIITIIIRIINSISKHLSGQPRTLYVAKKENKSNKNNSTISSKTIKSVTQIIK